MRRRRPKALRSRCRLLEDPPPAPQASPQATTTAALHPSALADFLTRIKDQPYLRKKKQSSSPTRVTTVSTATMKKMTIAILLGNGSKKEAR